MENSHRITCAPCFPFTVFGGALQDFRHAATPEPTGVLISLLSSGGGRAS